MKFKISILLLFSCLFSFLGAYAQKNMAGTVWRYDEDANNYRIYTFKDAENVNVRIYSKASQGGEANYIESDYECDGMYFFMDKKFIVSYTGTVKCNKFKVVLDYQECPITGAIKQQKDQFDAHYAKRFKLETYQYSLLTKDRLVVRPNYKERIVINRIK